MKNIVATLLLFPLSTLYAQQVSLDDVQNHMNTTVTVCGKVFNGVHLEAVKNTPTLINMGGIFPNHQLTLLIWGEDLKDFPAKPEQHYANQQVCVTGLVVEYRGKPEIVLKSPNQIQIQRETSANASKNIGKSTLPKVAEKPTPTTVEKTLSKGQEKHDDIKLSADVKVRSLPSASASVAFSLASGSIVTFLKSSNGWSHISVKKAMNSEALPGKDGFVKNDLLQGETLSSNTNATTAKLAVETKPVISKPINILPVQNQNSLPANNTSDVKLMKDEVKLSSTVDMRAGPGEMYKLTSQVKAGTVVTVLFSSNGWSQVVVKNSTNPSASEGYVNNKVLQ